MLVLEVGLFNPVKIRINFEEQYFEIIDVDVEPIRYPFDDPDDIINTVELYTTLSQDDIQRIYDECVYHGLV